MTGGTPIFGYLQMGKKCLLDLIAGEDVVFMESYWILLVGKSDRKVV